jgi:hypothetical protein
MEGDMGGILGASAELALRSAALPWFLGARWLSLRWRPLPDEVPSPATTLSLAAKMAGDELFLAAEVVTASVISLRTRARVAREMADALLLYDRCGWIDDPAGYHLAPAAPLRVGRRARRSAGLDYEHVCFESEWEPPPGSPGRERWLAYAANRKAHAWVLRHPGAPRPWLVCTPGYRMGTPAIDFLGFRAAWLHRELGLNVAIPVLPLHGPRRVGRRGGDGFLTGDVLDTIHAQAQAVWDVRRLVRWIRQQDAPGVGVYGLSLGAYTAGLVAGLERELACVIAGIPASCWLELLRSHVPRSLLRLSERAGFPWPMLERLARVVSPLALEPRVPAARRFVFAATGDRLAPPQQARDLWRHWGRPRLQWYEGSHTSFLLEPDVKALVHEAVGATGLLPVGPPAPARRRTRARTKSPARRPATSTAV